MSGHPRKPIILDDPEENEGGGEEWQTTYMDTVTILLTFFIIMASSADPKKVLIAGTNAPAGKEISELGNNRVLFFPIESLNSDLERLMEDELDDGKLVLEKRNYEIRMLFSGSSLYNLGEAELLPEGKAIIERIVERISEIKRKDFKVDVEGHTDSAPIRTFKFSSNWELSAARASNVVRYFLESGIPAAKLKASGYADAFLLEKDTDDKGKYIPEKQDKNRRIVIRLYFD